MYLDTGGSVEHIQGVDVNVPPVGYVWNPLTSVLEKRGVIKRSGKKSEQYWERMSLPPNWGELRSDEKKRQAIDDSYSDPVLDGIRQQAWDRRLCGCWFMNNGNPVYVSPLHCFYLDWIYIAADSNRGYPSFYDSDRKFFYFLEYAINDPRSLGVLLLTKRRSGKTAKSVAFLLDLPTRAMSKHAGIQSKTEHDAKDIVWMKGVMRAFKKLPDFFIPTYDQTGGAIPKRSLVLVDTPARGRASRDKITNVAELEGTLDWRSSKETAYDGAKLHRYVADEIFKTKDVDIRERHRIVRPCCTDDNGKFIGKMLSTSTVEEIEGKVKDYIQFWKDSDPGNRNEITGQTKTGLYRFFLPSDEARNRDRYGHVNVEENREYILASRDSYRDDLKAFYSYMRKEPLTIEEAFRVSKGDSIFDTVTLNEQLDMISWQDNLYERGNFKWEGGVRDSAVVWAPSKRGKFKIRRLMDGESIMNARKVGASYYPRNPGDFIMGVDPYDHDTTVDGRRSDGAGYVLNKFDGGSDFSYSPIVEYIHRPRMARIFYEDMLLCAAYYGAPILYENNKPGMKSYFSDRGYLGFLVKLPMRNEPGIPGSKQTHQMLAEHLEEYVTEHTSKIFFPDLLKDLIEFDIGNTTTSDATMAFGYALIGDKKLFIRKGIRMTGSDGGLSSIFKKRKVRRG